MTLNTKYSVMIALSHMCMQTHDMVETLKDVCTYLNDGQLHITF